MKTLFASQVSPGLDKTEAELAGWMRELRLLGENLAFVVLADSTGDCQLTFVKKNVGEKMFSLVKSLNREDAIWVKGVVQKTKQSHRGVEILPTDFKVLNPSKTPLPLDVAEKTPAELDTRLDSRVLDLRRPKIAAIFKIRAKILELAREYFIKNNFIEIETPKIIASASEGGAALFPVQYFDRKAFLRQSPQLYKELMTACFERVFEIGQVFRAEPSDTPRHIAEVTQMDVEMGFCDEKDSWKIIEGIMEHIYKGVAKDCAKELELLGRTLSIPKLPLKRVAYSEIIKKLGLKFGDDIPPEGEKKITEIYKDPVIVYEYPLEMKPFYIQPHETDKKLSYGFDLIGEGIELASGGRRVHDPKVYTARLKEKGLDPKNFKDILKFYDYGMPPHAGWAIGIDRLTMVICGLNNVREAVLFPRDIKRLTP